MAKLTVQLKQHTPIIHFQSHQNGATLRASDVKPRIDNFLGGTQKYKLTISAEMEGGYPKDKGNEPYFGDHKLCFYKNIKLVFNTYFDEDLRKKIEEILPKVFTLENFGSFGNKGYGCFTTEKISITDFQKLLKEEYKTVYYWDAAKTSPADILFEIKYFYALVKSGINVLGRNISDPKTYYKSLLMLYFKDKIFDSSQSIRWEKRGIKKVFNLTAVNNRTRNLDQTDYSIPDNEVYSAIKPLLGYSELQEWLSYGLRKDRRYPANSNPIKIELPNDIDRIPSPIFFKVFNDNSKVRIYFMLKNEKEFENKVYPNKTFKYTIQGKDTQFNTPANFNYSNFLNYVVNEINNNLIAKSASSGTPQRVDNFIKHITKNKIGSL